MTDYLDKVVSALDVGSVPNWITVHVKDYERTGGRESHMWDSTAVGGKGLVPCLLLTTVGRKSGEPYTHPLLYGLDGESHVIVASKGGSETQPQWYFNLLATPVITVQVKAEKFSARAILAEGATRERLWKLMTEVIPPIWITRLRLPENFPCLVLRRSRNESFAGTEVPLWQWGSWRSSRSRFVPRRTTVTHNQPMDRTPPRCALQRRSSAR